MRDIHETRVLVVEDDPILREQLRELLVREGYRSVRAEGTLADALLVAATWQPQLLLLDVMLPDGNGFDLLRRVRETGDVPALFLSARDEDESRLRGLGMGADDYVTKPFSIRELLARAAAFLRRRAAGKREVYCFGECELNLVSHKLLRRGSEVPLTAKEFRMLEHFASHPGRAMTRGELLDAVWGRSVIVTARSVDRCVTTLRAKIEREPAHPRHVITIRDIGYRFEPCDEG